VNHLMNTDTNSAAAFASSSRDNPCYGNDPTVATLNVFADDERSYQLPYAQFLYAVTTPNLAVEKDADAPPEKLVIAFAVANVTVLGSGLRYIERAIQKYELKFLKSAARRYSSALKTHVAAVTIRFNKEIA
jgi:hypothetical protein